MIVRFAGALALYDSEKNWSSKCVYICIYVYLYIYNVYLRMSNAMIVRFAGALALNDSEEELVK
jgi:hypothetical protein